MDRSTIKELYTCFLVYKTSFRFWSGSTWFFVRDETGHINSAWTDEALTKYLIGELDEPKDS